MVIPDPGRMRASAARPGASTTRDVLLEFPPNTTYLQRGLSNNQLMQLFEIRMVYARKFSPLEILG